MKKFWQVEDFLILSNISFCRTVFISNQLFELWFINIFPIFARCFQSCLFLFWFHVRKIEHDLSFSFTEQWTFQYVINSISNGITRCTSVTIVMNSFKKKHHDVKKEKKINDVLTHYFTWLFKGRLLYNHQTNNFNNLGNWKNYID